jgi:hypothetical protein
MDLHSGDKMPNEIHLLTWKLMWSLKNLSYLRKHLRWMCTNVVALRSCKMPAHILPAVELTWAKMYVLYQLQFESPLTF